MKKVGVIRGGNWEGYKNSLKEAADLIVYIQNNLADKYEPVDIFVDSNDIWHIKGLPIMPSDLVHKVDTVWNLAHAGLGQILTNFYIPHVSIPAFSSALKQSREMLREHMKSVGVSMPMHFVIPAYLEDIDKSIETYATKGAKSVFEKFGSPWIVKEIGSACPPVPNGTFGRVAKTYPELVNAIIDGAEHGGSIVVEELIPGREVNMHSLKNFRNENIYIFPGQLKGLEKENLYQKVKDIHEITSADYLNSQFILHPRGEIYLKSLEFSPDFSADSSLHGASQNIGINASQILESMLENY